MRHFISCATALVWALMPPAACWAAGYSVTDLGRAYGIVSGTLRSVVEISNTDLISGTTTFSSSGDFDYHAYSYSGGVKTDLGTLSTGVSFGNGINDSGEVAGTDFSGLHNRAFLFTGGTMQDLGTLGGQDSAAYGINNLGQVTGYAYNSAGVYHAFVYSGGVMQDLGTLPSATRSVGNAVNDSGEVVGSSAGTGGVSHAFLYRDGVMHDLNTLGGKKSEAHDINERGQVVGESATNPNSPLSTAFLYSDGVMQSLGTLGSLDSAAYGVNNLIQVVGTSDIKIGTTTQQHAFLHEGGTMYDLNDLIDALSGWELESATGINDLGEIVGWGAFGDTVPHAFLLTPVPEPSSVALFGIAGCALIGWAGAVRLRRRRPSRPRTVRG